MNIVILVLLVVVALTAGFAAFSLLRMRGRMNESEALKSEFARLMDS